VLVVEISEVIVQFVNEKILEEANAWLTFFSDESFKAVRNANDKKI